MPTTFAVSDVEPGDARLECASVPEAIHALTTNARQVMDKLPDGTMEFRTEREPMGPLEAWSPVEGGVIAPAVHPFVGAIELAFQLHLPLELSPDHVWIVLAQGFAQHVRLHAEQLRHQFVSHAGKETLHVRRDEFVKGSPSNPWPEVFDAFADQLRDRIGKRHDLIVADFSTTGPLERAISQLVLMDAMEKYFEYAFHSACGIPNITLTGTAEDWRAVRTRAQVFREFGLDFWLDPLTPILDAFVAASEGSVDASFWRSIYKRNSSSGGPFTTGWVHVLFPYLLLRDERGRGPRVNPDLAAWSEGMNAPFGGGPTTEQFPGGLSSVPFVWHYREQHRFDMEFLGGFIGVEQCSKTLGVTPRLGWAVRDAAGSLGSPS